MTKKDPPKLPASMLGKSTTKSCQTLPEQNATTSMRPDPYDAVLEQLAGWEGMPQRRCS